MHLEFDFPANLTAEKFIAKLSDKTNAEIVSRHYSLITFYDSFDWRLYKNGITCELIRSKTASTLVVKRLENGFVIASTAIKDMPPFSQQIQSKDICNTLTPLLEMRALLPLCNLDYEIVNLNILNKDKKIVLRMIIEEHVFLNNRLILQPIKGYHKAAEQIIDTITPKFG